MNDLKVTTPLNELETLLMNENDPDKIQDIVDLFNVNLRKRDIVRSVKLSEAQDRVVDQMLDRVTHEAEGLSTKEIIMYHDTIQKTLDKSTTNISNMPQIQINNINVQDEAPKFNKESRSKIVNAVNTIIKQSQNSESVTELSEDEIEVINEQ